MVNYYDELEIEDFSWDPISKVFHYPCPCGDRFEITKAQLRNGEEIATCPSCSLIVRVIYDYLDWEDYTTTDDEAGSDSGSEFSDNSSEDKANSSKPNSTANCADPSGLPPLDKLSMRDHESREAGPQDFETKGPTEIADE